MTGVVESNRDAAEQNAYHHMKQMEIRWSAKQSSSIDRHDRKNIPVLAARCTMQVDDHLDVVVPSPSHSLLEVRKLALDIWFTARHVECPEPNGNADVVQAVAEHLSANALFHTIADNGFRSKWGPKIFSGL